jgi:hypothetical protein
MSVWKQYTPTDKVILAGNAETGEELSVETTTGMIPGVLVIGGTTDDDVIVGISSQAPIGVLGYEKTSMLFRPMDAAGAYYTMDGTYPASSATKNSRAFVHQATDIAWYAWWAASDGTSAGVIKGQLLYPAASGQLSVTAGSGGAARAYAVALESKSSSTSAQRLKVERV